MIDRWNNPVKFGSAGTGFPVQMRSRRPDQYGVANAVSPPLKLKATTYEMSILDGKPTVRKKKD